MIQQDYILLILNCKKYLKKAKFQKMTWIPKLPEYIAYYHVIGDITLDTDYRFDDEARILWVKVEDDYNSLPKKVIRAYDAVNKSFDFKYIFKTDDDQILANSNFFTVLKDIVNKTPKIHYGGYVVDIKETYFSDYHKIHPELPPNLPLYVTKYCTGRFYFLSKQGIISLISRRHHIEKEYFEDYAIGFNLHPIYKVNMLNLPTNKYFTDIEYSDYPELVANNAI